MDRWADRNPEQSGLMCSWNGMDGLIPVSPKWDRGVDFFYLLTTIHSVKYSGACVLCVGCYVIVLAPVEKNQPEPTAQEFYVYLLSEYVTTISPSCQSVGLARLNEKFMYTTTHMVHNTTTTTNKQIPPK